MFVFAQCSYAKEKTVTLDFSGADLVQVIKLIAKESKCDCVIESSVTGTVNMHLKDVPLSVALGVILKTAGYDYKKVDNLIIVAAPKNLSKIASGLYSGGGADTYQVIMLEHANAAQIIETLQGAVPGVAITADNRINAVIVNGSVGAIRRVKDLVSKLDVPASNTFAPDVQTKIFDLSYAKVEDVEPQIKSFLSGLNYQIDKRTNSFVVIGTKQIFDKFQNFLSTVDTPLQQVALEVKVLSLSNSNKLSTGSNAPDTTITTALQEVVNTGAGYALPTYVDLRFGGVFPFARTPISVNYILSSLVDTQQAEIIANPTVSTLNGKEAKLVSSVRYNILSYDSRSGQYTTMTVDVGITITVTPSITEDGFVVMKIKPEVSDLKSLVAQQFPWTNVRNAEMTIRVKDGEPVVIGGLRKRNLLQTNKKVPFIGDIPVLGEMFKYKEISKRDDELVIMVIPRILPKV